MTDGYRILVVEDDAAVRRLVTTTLDLHGYAYREARTASQALLELSSQPPDLAILDLGLPDGDGVEVIRTLRGWSSLPVIVLSARLEDADKVEALDAGADDYLVKPFSVEELLARVRVALRRLDRERAMQGDADEAVYRNGSLRIDYAAGSVWRAIPARYSRTTTCSKRCGAPCSRPIARRFACSWPRFARRSSPILRTLATSKPT